MDLFLIYLWLKLDGLGSFLGILGIGLTLATLFVFIPRIIDRWDVVPRESEVRAIKLHNHSIWISLCIVVLSLLIPSSKDVAILVGSSIALDVAKSPEGAKVASLLRGKANELLDAELQKLTPKKGN